MACKKITKTNESESILIQDLENIFGNEYKAEGAYAYFESDSFINEFGDYVEGYNNADKSFYGRVDDNGEPKLFYDDTAKKHYFLDKNKEKIFYPLINRGLRSLFNYKQIDKITSRLALNYFNESKLNFLNFNTLSFEERGSLPNLKQFIKTEIENKIQELRAKGGRFMLQALVLEKSLKNLNEYVENVDLFFKENSIKRVNILNEDELQSEEDDIKDPSFTKSSFEQDSKNSISTNVKLKLSLLEDTNDLDPVWGEPTFKPFSEVYSDLINNITNQVALEGEDLFELQKEQIQRLTIKKPYLKQLLSFFDNKQFTEEDKNQFTQAFNLHGNNFLVSEVKFVTKKKEGKALTQITSHDVMEVSKSGSKAAIVASEWGNNFKNKFLEEDNKLKEGSKEYIEQVKNDLEALKELVKPNISRKEFEDNVNKFLNISRKLGIELTKDGLMNYLDGEGAFFFDTEKQIDTLSKSVTQSIIAVKKALKDFSKTSVDFKNPFDKEGVFKKMAKAESFFMAEGSDASIWSSGKNKWLFSYPSYLSTRIKQWQKNPELLRNWKNASAYNKGSALMKYLLAEDLDPNMTYEDSDINETIRQRLEGLKLGIFNTFQDNDGNYSDSSDLSFKDYFNDYVNKTLSQSYLRTTTPADKGTDYQIKTGFFIDSFNSLDNNGETVFTQQTLDTFFDYFNSEFNRMKEAHKEVDSLKNNPESLFVNYHYKEGSKIDDKNGNAFLSQYFPELSYNSGSKNELVNRIKDELYVKKSGVYPNEIKHTTDLVANKELTNLVKQYIKESLRQGVESTIDNFLSEGIFDVNEEGEIDNFGISRKVFDKYMEENLLNKEQALIAMASDFYINGLVSNIEYSKMFTGDVAFYKDMVDYKKRVPATYTDGLQLRLKSGEEFFNAATTSKVKIKPQEYAKIEEILGKEGAKPYANTNSADGQAWITPARWKFLMERLGKWSNLHSSVYEKMISDNPKPYTKEELKVVGQALKGVYFYMNGKTPTFLKYSQAVLTKQLVKGTGLQRVYDQMNTQEVDELITLDGIKVGSNMPTTIHNEDGTVKDEFTFNVNQLSNYGWKLQQDLPTKTIKQTAVGSQIQKNIFAGLIFNKELSGFELDGKETNGQTIINNIVNIVDGLVEKGLAEVRDEFKVFRNGEIKNVKGFYNALVRELEERGGSKNVIEALKKETTLYGVPQSMDKIMSIFSSIMNDRLIKIKTNGGAFIQMSNFGINKDEAVEQGIIMHPSLKTGETAYEPHFYTDENGKKKVKPGGVFISGSFIAKYIPNYKKYSAEELFIGKDGNPPIIDERIRKNLIGYRIPNQGLSSNDALEIIGILPEENGDTIVAYTGITTKTGSDFDIDKMYLMMANYTLEEGRLVYTEYEKMLSNKRQSKEALQNRLIELYKSVLTHNKVLKDVMKPLDDDTLKDNITNLLPTDTSGVLFHFDSYNDAKLRYEYTGGKAGVGQEANALVDINRLGELSINKYFIGWGAKNQKGDTKLDNEYSEELSKEDLDYYVNELIEPGSDKARVDAFRESIKKIKISDSLTAILNAFVDIAKDPYITRGNWVTSTTNTGNLLIRSGVHPLYTTSFMAQPIIKEYIEYQSSLESILGNNSGDMKAKFKRNLVINDLKKSNDKFPDLKKSLPFIYQKLVRSEKSGLGFLVGNKSKEKLDKILGKNISEEKLEEILTFLKDAHSKIFEEKTINVTDYKYNLKYYRDQIKLEQDGAFQVALLDKFFELQEISKALRENVDVSKVDTNGMGKNINSLYSIFNLKQHILDKESTDKKGVLVGLASKFDKTPLGTYLDSLKEVMRIVQANPSLFPQGQQDVQALFNEISNDLYSMPAVDEKLMTELEKSYYTYVMSNFPAFNLSSVETRQLLDKLPERFSEFKKQNKDKYLILDELQIKNQGKLKLIALNNRKKSPDFEQKITDSWRDLIIDNPELGEDLIRYSFITSGFRMNANQFYTYMPHEFLVKEGIDHFVKNFSKEDHSDFIDKFYLNNTADYKFVNRVFDNELESQNFDTGFILKEPGKAKYYLKRELEDKNFNELGEEVAKKEKKYLTYKLEGYNSRNQAVYTRVQPLGNKSKGATIVEYGDVFTKNTLIIDETYIDKLKNTIVTSRNQFNPNFVLDKIEDRVEDLSNDVTIEQLREEERIEMASKIPNIENYKVDGKIDKTLMLTPVLNKYNEIYDKYDKLITPLLQKESTQSSTSTEVVAEPITSMSEITNHSGGAYGADTFWDQIGREFGVTKHMHYRESANSNISQKLRNAKVEATVITKEELEAARTEIEKLLGIKFSDTLEGNLQVRNYYQVANSDAVFAIAKLDTNKDFNSTAVLGGTNTAVQLGIKLGKPVYVWDIFTEQWHKFNGEVFEKTKTPILTKNFAGVGSRDIESYSVKDKETGNWKPRKEYLGTAKENAAKQAIRDVYKETKDSISEEVNTEESSKTEETTVSTNTELIPGQYVKYNNETYIVTQENTNGTIQIYNPNLVGASSKISVSKDKLTALNSKAKIVEHKGVNYIVTPSNTIISMTSNKVMKYLENDGNKKAILEKAGNNITKAPEVKVETTNYLTETKSQPQSQMSFKPANKQQEDAITAIKDFIENGNPQEIFMLEGKAGTGKTTIVQEALANSVAKGKNIQIAALSHKAKLVLASKLEERFPKKIGSSSIAGLLGMTMDQETGEFEPGYGMERPIENADIIVIDEASMVNEESLGLIMSEKRRGAKVIFLGDRGQLPPIRKLSSDEISPVFESPNKASLTERVRQGEESPILPFADYFWDNSESSSPKANPIPEGEIKDTLSEKGNLVFINNLNDAFDDVVETFRKGVNEKNFNVIKIVTYRNATRQSYNNKIRREIFGEEVPQFVVKDQIMFQNNYTLDKYTTFSNSDEFAIEQVNETTKNGYKVFDIGVRMSSKENKLTYFPVIHKEDKAKFDEDVSKRFEAAKAMPKGDLRKFAYQQAWSLKGMFAEIDYSYAITSHKSQGSTYDNVIVDLKDIYGVGATSNKSKSQSVYTALTRAKNTAIVITSKSETNNDNVKKSLAISKKITLTKEQQDKADELKKYCNPG